MAKMTKAEMDAFKKKNFDLTKKVTEVQLDKLRKEGTPTKAIAKYKNDPAMREALNRFYGKDRVSKTIGSGNTTKSNLPPGKGPGNTRPKPPMGKGPGNTRPKSPTAVSKGEGSSSSSTGKGVAAAAGATAIAVGAAKAMTKMDRKDVANAKAAAGKHRKMSGPKHAAPRGNPRAEASKYVKKTTARRAAAKTGVTNKMKAQGARIMSSAGSRYNQARRGK
jgi:hypothetical protein